MEIDMKYQELEARLQLLSRQISAIQMSTGPLYRIKMLPLRHRRWKTFVEPKMRLVLSPRPDLKAVQRQMHQLISHHFEPHPIVHAYVKGRGIVTNARQHVGKEWLFHVDLVNFFGSIKEELVIEGLWRVLRNLSQENMSVIAQLCCHEGFLPQGSPASPILSNLACFPLDRRLQEFGKSLGITVTRYSDDICFSSTNAILPDELAKVWGRGAAQLIELGAPLRNLFEPYGFKINFKKLRFQDRTERQQVTGLVVNDRVNVPKEYYRTIRRNLRLWDERGIDVAARQFQRQHSANKFVKSLKGLIDYIGQVTGRSDIRYRDLLRAFEKLKAGDMARLHLA